MLAEVQDVTSKTSPTRDPWRKCDESLRQKLLVCQESTFAVETLERQTRRAKAMSSNTVGMMIRSEYISEL